MFLFFILSVGMAQTSVLGEGDVVDVTLQQRAMALGGAPTLATLNNGGAVATLPRHALKGQFPRRITMLEFLDFLAVKPIYHFGQCITSEIFSSLNFLPRKFD